MTSKGGLIVVGSDSVAQAKTLEYYVAIANVWIQALQIDTDNRIRFKSILYEDELVLVSGFKDGKAVTTVTSYNFSTGKTKTLPSLNKGGRNIGLAVVAHHLYAIGGMDAEAFDRVERYSPFSDRWETLAPLSTKRHNCGVVVQNGEIYVTGGLEGDTTRISDVEAFDVVAGTWRKCAPMNEKRNGHGAVALGEYIYVFGGDNGIEALSSAERYDPNTDKWTFIESANTRRYWVDADVLDNKTIVVAGGFDESGDPTNIVESYNPETDQWKILAPLNEKRANLNLVRVPWSPTKTDM